MLAPTLLALSLLAAPPTRTHDIQPEDYFSVANLQAVAPSPDGRWVVWEEQRWQDDLPTRNRDLWVAEVAKKQPRRLTFDPAGDGHAEWSPDGEWIYFTSARKRAGEKAPFDGRAQVWRIRRDGSGLTPVTRVEGGVEGYALTADGRALVYTTKVDHYDDDPWKGLRKEHKKLVYGRGVRKLSAVWRIDLTSWRADKLIDSPTRYVSELAIAPEGDRIAMITVPTRRLIDNEGWSWLEVLDVASRTTTRVKDDAWRGQAPSPYGWLSSPAWSADGRKLAVRVDFDGYPGELFVAHLEGARTAGVMRLPRIDEITLSGEARWRPGSNDLCVKAVLHARDHLYCVQSVTRRGHGAMVRITGDDEGTVHGWAFSRNGQTLALTLATRTHMPDVYVLPARGARGYTRVTNQNPQMDRWKLPSIQTVRWKSKDGAEVEGILELPPGYDGKSKLPFAVEIHGGPTSATRDELRFWIYGRTLLAARGWALLSPNYRGSTGYGDAFLTDLIGRKNDVDVEDILSGVDAMVARGIADPERMAVMGWSNGGYLTNCILTRTDRFKAASSGAGVVDTAMQWMIEDTPGHVVNFSQGLPWTKADVMRRTSPLYDLSKVKTPTLVHVGMQDARVPAQHARALFRALGQYLGVPTELVEYPGAPHSLVRRDHRAAKMAWDLAWFDRWVLQRDEPEEE